MRVRVSQQVIPHQLRQELSDALGLDYKPNVTYNAREGWVEVDVEAPEVPEIVSGHTADGTALWPHWKRRLYEGLVAREESPHWGSNVESLVERYVLEQMRSELGGFS